VGTEQFKRDFVNQAVNGELSELVRALVLIDDAQASFQILRLYTVFRLSHLLRTGPPSITHEALSFDALIQCALATIIADDGAAPADLPTPEKAANDPSVCRNQIYVRYEALRQSHLPIPEGRLVHTSSDATKGAACIGCQALLQPLPARTSHLSWNGSPSARWCQYSLTS